VRRGFTPFEPVAIFGRVPAEPILVCCTFPDAATAQGLGRSLVEAGMAACASVTAPLTSVYRWQGRTEVAEEVLMLIKTTRERYAELETAILAAHPYELPEIIALPVTAGLRGYLEWVEQCTTAS
jgi:periplasmic divalent cation tolerance protein